MSQNPLHQPTRLPPAPIVAMFAALAALALACGPASQTIPSTFTPDQFPQNPLDPQRPIGDLAGIPTAVFDAMAGTYEGTLYGYDDAFQIVTQNFSLELSRASAAGRPYALARFRSEGALGSASFDTPMGAGLTNYFNTWSLASSAIDDTGALSSSAVQLLLTFQFSAGGTTISPAQSRIRMLDCGFSRTVCLNDLTNVWFADGLRKR
jgi:hypothetical protein